MAAASGLLAFLAMEPAAVPGLVVVCLVPLFASLEHAIDPAAFVRRGLLFSAIFYTATLSWLFSLTGFSWTAIPAAVYTIASHVVQVFVALAAIRIGTRKFGMPLLLVAPLAFVVAEDLRSHGDLAVPWAALGYGLGSTLPLAQIADLAGIAGLTAWVVAVNAALWQWLRRRSPLRLLALAAVVLLPLAYDLWRWRQPEPSSSLRVAVLQPNISQRDKWNPKLASQHVRTLRRQTAEAGQQGAELVIWPEAALPFMLDLDDDQWRRLSPELLAGARGLLIGASTGSGRRSDRLFDHNYNSAILFDANGDAVGVYHKRQLVPMTEGMPFAAVLGWFSRFFPREYAKLSPGDAPEVLRAPGLPPLGSVICFESVFARLAREERLAGAEILVNVTNDAWFGRSFAPHQHAVFPAIRAIEQRMPVARSANTGISALYDTHGRAIARAGIYRQAVLVADLPWGAPPSPYTRFGDWLVWIAYLLVGGTYLAACLRRPAAT
jgi:apolipoprotein N-acyltransferase